MNLILASTSPIRQKMFKEANLTADFVAPELKENILKDKLLANGISLNDLSLELAKAKALSIKAEEKQIVIGCDQVCELEGDIVNKGGSFAGSKVNLTNLQGKTHFLHTAVCASQNNEIIWHYCFTSKLTMLPLNEQQIEDYINLDQPYYCAASYKFEENGHKLFSQVTGDENCIKGLPLNQLKNWLSSIS